MDWCIPQFYLLSAHTSLCKAPDLRYPLHEFTRSLGWRFLVKIRQKVVIFKVTDFPKLGLVHDFINDEKRDEKNGLRKTISTMYIWSFEEGRIGKRTDP
jgi:hypothetical protein